MSVGIGYATFLCIRALCKLQTLETGNVNLASRASQPHTIMLLRSWNIALVCDQNRDHWAGTKQRSVAL